MSRPRAAAERTDGLAALGAAVRGFALRLVGDPALADDLAQEALGRAHRARGGFRGEAAERSWLFAIALNVVRDHFRAQARAPKTTSDPALMAALPAADNTEGSLLEREMATCIGGYVLRLPPRQQDAVALHDLAGLSHSEVAAALGVSEGHCRVLVHRGRAALKALLEENCELSFDDPIPCERKP